MVGQVKVPVSIGAFKTEQAFVVVSKLTVDCLLGVDYLLANEAIINYKHHCVVINTAQSSRSILQLCLRLSSFLADQFS